MQFLQFRSISLMFLDLKRFKTIHKAQSTFKNCFSVTFNFDLIWYAKFENYVENNVSFQNCVLELFNSELQKNA